jgi:hypothetical protein
MLGRLLDCLGGEEELVVSGDDGDC